MEETRKNEPGGQPAKEKKPKRELSPKEVQQRKKMIVFPLMFLAFAGCMYLIFAPSGKDKADVESVGGFNADLPLPAEDGIIADKQTAYEQAVVNRKRQDRIQSLQDFGFTPDGEAEGRQGNAEPMPEADEEKEELKRQVAELTERLQRQQTATPTADDQLALLEKSYELAAKYAGGGQAAQVPVTGGIEKNPDAVSVRAVRENTVSGLSQPMSDADFIRAYSQPLQHGGRQGLRCGQEHDSRLHPPRPDPD